MNPSTTGKRVLAVFLLVVWALVGAGCLDARGAGRAGEGRGPAATLRATPTSGAAPLTVTFTAAATDPGGGTLDCTLRFGDGETAALCSGNVRHVYASAGAYNARLQVRNGADRSAEARVQITVTTPETPLTVFAAGDIAYGDDHDEATARLIQELAPEEGDGYVLALGDLAYPDGAYEEFVDYYDPSWGAFKNRTHPVPGNHEYHTRDAAGYFRYWGERAAGPHGWYSAKLGDWSLFALNTNCSEVGGCGVGSDQYAWLKNELKNDSADCALMIGHHPRYSHGPHGNARSMDDLWDLFYEHGGELYLSGHDHAYERFYPLDDSGARDDGHGVVQFVVGTGGRSLYELTPGSDTAKAVQDRYGVLELKLFPDGYSWRFVGVDGEVHDRGEGRCHPAP